MNNSIGVKSIVQLSKDLRNGIVTSSELVEESLSKITAGKHLNAFISVFDKESRLAASAQQTLLDNGYDLGPLQGIPIAVKDNIDAAYGRTTYGSSIFSNFQASQDATVVRRLKAAGAVIVGKTNLHEFAWGGTTSNPHYGTARNPWDTNHTPGGSSGGSGIAVAAHMVCCALGTDTGGSIRLPAAMNGVCGLRPTLGDVSIRGIFPVAWSMDTVGPLCSNAEDLELVYAIMKGSDYVPVDSAELSHLKIAIIDDYSMEGLQPSVRSAFKAALSILEHHGAQVSSVAVPGINEVVSAQLVVDAVEPSAAHYKLISDRPEDYGTDVLARLKAGCDFSGVEYVQAQRFRLKFRHELEHLFRTNDVILTPTLPFTAPEIGATQVQIDNTMRVSALSGNMKYTAIASMSGFPAMSIPIGFDDDHLPIGMQIITPAHHEDRNFAIAKAYQTLTDFHKYE